MADAQQINWFNDAADDPLLGDGVPEFTGGQFSNWRANLLKANQSSQLVNAMIDNLGKIQTRRGTVRVGSGTAGTGTLIQGLTSYQTKDFNYIVAANGGKIWSFNGVTWDQIGLGGAVDNDEIVIFRTGQINQPAVVGPPAIPAGYIAGTTVLTVDTLVGIVGKGEKLYFVNNIKNAFYEYVIADAQPGAGPTVTITLEEPGLVFDVGDNWSFFVARPALINHAARYAAGYGGALTIDNYGTTGTVVTGGTINAGEIFVIKSENVTHKALTVSGGPPTTSIDTWQNWDTTTNAWVTGALQADWAATNSTVPVVFAQGNDSLYFCDGVGPIYGWNGKTLANLNATSVIDFMSGSAYTHAQTTPPKACKILLWFQNRLIASGISAEPDAIYFSDFFDATKWDKNYQKIRIGGGESDPITGLLAWTDLNMVVFKKNSIYVINLDPTQNPDPADPTLLVASFAVKQIHKKIGCPAPLTAVQVGGSSTTPGSDVFFLDSNKKVRSIRRVLAAETQQEVGNAISLPIQDVLDEINLQLINQCTAFYHNDHYILAFPKGSDTRPASIVAYSLLNQTWAGEWTGWWPTCFAMRTDLGDYSKMIFGQWDGSILDSPSGADISSGVGGTVFQWLDDECLDNETDATYQDNGVNIGTQILTRAITFGDFFSYKTGLNVEFEFDESWAVLTVQVILDKVVQHTLVAAPFATTAEVPLRLPVVIPFTLPGTAALRRMAFDLQRYGTWRELQFKLGTTQKKLSIRSIRVTGFFDSIQLQTTPGASLGTL